MVSGAFLVRSTPESLPVKSRKLPAAFDKGLKPWSSKLPRWAKMVCYILLSTLTAASLPITIAFSDSILEFVMIWGITYFGVSAEFVVGHVYVHDDFMDMLYNPSEAVDHDGVKFAFVHHYLDIRCFDKFWLEYRVMYFGVGTPNMMFAYPCYFLLAKVLSASYGFALALTLARMTWWHFQTVTHEWYHCPESKRRTYWFITRMIFRIAETMNIINTMEHKVHHKHGLNNPEDVEQWTDTWTFKFFDSYGDWIWKRLLEERKAGKKKSLFNLFETQLNFAWVGTIAVSITLKKLLSVLL